MQLSIIVPVYNVAEYLTQCLNSLILNSFSDYEVIIINDGSTDNSLDKIKAFHAKHVDSNIVIIDQLNKGLSASRNIGLLKARGEYVLFVDSDDWIDSNALIMMLKNCKDENDVIIGNYTVAYEDGSFQAVINKTFQSELVNKGPFFLVNFYINTISSVVWRSIYRRDFLLQNNLFFLEGVYYEDVEWGPKVFYTAQKVMTCLDTFYFYRVRSGSIMNSLYNEKRFRSSLQVASELSRFSKTINDLDARKVVVTVATYLLQKSFALYPDSTNKEEKRELISIINEIESGDKKFLFFRYGMRFFPKILKSILLKMYK